MRSVRRNIGERSANPSSLPAAGRPDDRWRMEMGGRGSTKSPSSSVQAVSHSRWRHIGLRLFRLVAFWGRSAMRWSVPFSLGEFLVEGPLLAPKPVHRKLRSMPVPRTLNKDDMMRIGKLFTRDQRVNPPTTRRAPRIDLRGRNPMVVEEDCPGTCEGEAARTYRYVADDGLYS
jgi:hypothetical protein